MSRELKISLLILTSIGMAVWGVNFLLGKNLFASSQTFYVEFDQVEGLAISTPIHVQGLRVGTVQDVYMNDEMNKVVVTIDLLGDLKVPKETVVQIWTASFMDGIGLQLDFRGKACVDNCAESGDYLQGRYKNFLKSMVTPEDAEMYISKGIAGLMNMQHDKDFKKLFHKFRLQVDSLALSTGAWDDMIRKNAGAYQQTIKSARLATDTLNAGMSGMKKSVVGVDKQLQEAAKTNWETKINGTKSTTDSLKTMLTSTSKAIAKADKKMQAIANGEGFLGRFVSKPGLSDSLNTTITSYTEKADSIRHFPAKYTGRGQ